MGTETLVTTDNVTTTVTCQNSDPERIGRNADSIIVTGTSVLWINNLILYYIDLINIEIIDRHINTIPRVYHRLYYLYQKLQMGSATRELKAPIDSRINKATNVPGVMIIQCFMCHDHLIIDHKYIYIDLISI